MSRNCLGCLKQEKQLKLNEKVIDLLLKASYEMAPYHSLRKRHVLILETQLFNGSPCYTSIIPFKT